MYATPSRSLSGRHVAQAQLMHSCLGAVKTSMLVLQRSQEQLSAALKTAGPECHLQRALGALMDRYTRILTDGELEITAL